jgi:uncharacterized RDD family membrane protein YckC
MNGTTPTVTHPAGFWIRLGAFLIDLLVIMVVQFLLQVIARVRFRSDAEGVMGAVAFFTFVFAVAYPTVLHTIAGQTLGKLATRVRVVALDGEALPLGASFLRAIAFWTALVFTFGIGHIVGGLRKDKRAFHDLLAGSRAERLPPAPSSRRLGERRVAAPPVAASPVAAAPFPPPQESEPRSIG